MHSSEETLKRKSCKTSLKVKEIARAFVYYDGFAVESMEVFSRVVEKISFILLRALFSVIYPKRRSITIKNLSSQHIV